MPRDARVEGLAPMARREVEALPPPEGVEVGDEILEALRLVSVAGLARDEVTTLRLVVEASVRVHRFADIATGVRLARSASVRSFHWLPFHQAVPPTAPVRRRGRDELRERVPRWARVSASRRRGRRRGR